MEKSIEKSAETTQENHKAMMIRLPEDGFVVLGNLSQSWLIYPALLVLGIMIYQSLTEKKELYNPEPVNPNVKIIHLVLGFIAWVGVDLLAFRWLQFISDETFMLTRNLSCIVIGFMIPILFSQGTSISYRSLSGRWSPPAKLIMFGFTSFLSLGLLFWGFSFLQPFRVKLASVQEINPYYLLSILLGVVLIPLTEEIIFRYLLYGFLRNRLGVILGILGSSLLFALLHGLSMTSLAIGIGAVIMTLLVELTNSIIPSLILHSGFNYLLLCGGFWM